jgi:hypothetical protein
VLGYHLALAADACQITPTEQHRVHPDLRHKDLHSGVGIADGDLPDHLETLGTTFDLERPWDQLQGGRRAQPMTQFKPEKAEAKQQGKDQQ